MQTERVGIRQFRENLSGYLESSEPVAITRHGQTIGFYVPAKRSVTEADKEALRAAGKRLSAWMESTGLDEDTLVEEFKALPKARPAKR
jgi:antitoxin ParD1/3/4